MGPDARCAAGLLSENGAERVHTHPQRILHLMVGDRAPFGLSCGGDAAAGWENQAGVEINGAPHCEHPVRAGATLVLDALRLAGGHTPFERPVSGRTRWTRSCKL